MSFNHGEYLERRMGELRGEAEKCRRALVALDQQRAQILLTAQGIGGAIKVLGEQIQAARLVDGEQANAYVDGGSAPDGEPTPVIDPADLNGKVISIDRVPAS